MIRQIIAAVLVLLTSVRIVAAQQEVVWVQIEAHPTLGLAQQRARDFAAELDDVNGFALGNGWYGIALGPYARPDAEQVLRVYRAEGAIPDDSYIAFSRGYGQQFWPIGANVLQRPGVPPLQALQPEPQAQPEPQTQPEPQAEATPTPPTTTTAVETVTANPTLPARQIDETPREARASEARLTRAEREALQVALKWAGFYDAAIDGAFGPGTRQSMAAWQSANNHEPTGVLTTLQRAALLRQYDAVLDGLGLAPVIDTAAGIEIVMPTSIVAFDRHDYPFAHYTATGDLPATVLLISQRGDRRAMYGLYDILQTLEIVPDQGPRRRDERGFLLVGEGADFVSQTEVTLEGDEIKGFTLIWPAGDEARRTRLLGEMRAGLRRLPGTLNPAQVGQDQRIDLIAGLEVRRPRLARSGFYVDTKGTIVTAAEGVSGCARITLEDGTEADLLTSDGDLGVAVLLPRNGLSPLGVAEFATTAPRLQSEVAVAGFSYGGLLGAPTVTFGTLADLRGLAGEDTLHRLEMGTMPGDAGGPVVDATGAVLGMLLPRPGAEIGRALPGNVNFAVTTLALQQMLDKLGIATSNSSAAAVLPAERLTTAAVGMTALVQCWD